MICSSFVFLFLFALLFLIFFLLFISFVFLLGWSSARVPLKLAGILTNNYYETIQLATSKMLKKVTLHAG